MTLSFAATARNPFGSGDLDALGYRIVRQDPDLDGVPPGLLPLIAACLAKNPDQRPDAMQILAMLETSAETHTVPSAGPAPSDWLPTEVLDLVAEHVPDDRAQTKTASETVLSATPEPEPEREAVPFRLREVATAGTGVRDHPASAQ